EADWRHFSFDDGGPHRFGPGTRGLVIEKRYRRNFTWTVAALTLRLQDRKNIFVESDCCSCRSAVSLTKRYNREHEQAAKRNSNRTHNGLHEIVQKKCLQRVYVANSANGIDQELN